MPPGAGKAGKRPGRRPKVCEGGSRELMLLLGSPRSGARGDSAAATLQPRGSGSALQSKDSGSGSGELSEGAAAGAAARAQERPRTLHAAAEALAQKQAQLEQLLKAPLAGQVLPDLNRVQRVDGYVEELPPLQEGELMMMGQVMHPKAAGYALQVRPGQGQGLRLVMRGVCVPQALV